MDHRDGLSDDEAARRLVADGPNRLPEPPTPSMARLVGEQLTEPLVAVLLVACALTAVVLREVAESVAILAIVAVDVAIGARQAHAANRAMTALAELVQPTATVRRAGRSQVVPAADVVRGDLLELVAGDRVAADARLVEASVLAVDEALLTGESLPVEKHVTSVPSERHGEVFAGTHVVRGRAMAEVTATGAATEVGGIAASLTAEPSTPLERDLAQAAGVIGGLAAAVGAALAVATYVRAGGGGDALVQAALVGVALAVAAVPEGLPAVVTVALALGARRMAAEGAIVRRLDAVEALGAADALCTDKTGTLTTGHLEVVEVVPVDGRIDDLWRAAVRCNDAHGEVGDPVDVALLAGALGVGRAAVETAPRQDEQPFDAEARLQLVVHDVEDGPVLSVKGAPSVVLARCASGPEVEDLAARTEALAAAGLRVLALADGRTAEQLGGPSAGGGLGGRGWRALGLVAFGDPLRAGSAAAVAAARGAGVRVVMVTGDHPATAAAVAAEAGIDATRVVTGADLAGLTPDERREALADAGVVARVTPAVKVELVEALRRTGAVVAMTGDGVNDAPALRDADIGVAVAGGPCTAVAREAADLVVTDGELGTIVQAMREGRRIFRNLVSVVGYLLAGNVAEVLVVAGGLVLLPELLVPLTAVQLLWINVVTDGLPAVALGADRPHGDPLRGAPRARHERLLGASRLVVIAVRGGVLAAALLGLALAGRAAGTPQDVLRTQLLAGLVLGQLALPYVVRARRWALESGWWRNGRLNAVMGVSLAVQLAVFVVPAGRFLLDLNPLSPAEWGATVGAVVVALAAMELARPWLGDGAGAQVR